MIKTIIAQRSEGEQASKKSNTIMQTRLDNRGKKIKHFSSQNIGLHMVEQGKDEKEDMIIKLCIK